LIGGIQCTTCGNKKIHHFEVCLKRYIYCTHCEHDGHNSRNCPMKKFTLSEFGNWLFKRQVKDDTLSQAISRCSLDGSPTNLELRKASHLVGHISRSSRRCNQYMNPFDSSIFLSVTRKSSNALVTFSDRICFECDEKGHYVNKCPQRRPKDQPTKTGIATLQSIQCSSSYKSQIKSECAKVSSHAECDTNPTRSEVLQLRGERSLFQWVPQSMYTSPFCIDHEYSSNIQQKTAMVCFHCGQRCHFALQCPDRCQ
jgi:hypothetical protein